MSHVTEPFERIAPPLTERTAPFWTSGADGVLRICRCGDCVLDMAAMAFNSVKPIYRFSLLGSLYAAQAMGDAAYAETVKQAVAQAIAKVTANPSHD